MEKYDPIRVLGEGSFGKVYLMRDKVRKKFVCVKIIKIKNIPKKEREATKVEVELLKRLHHPNIVRYIDSFLSKNSESLCIAMEYCDGGDLASQVKAARKKLFSEDKILHWFVQIALGVHYMHTQNVLHRDLKTQNIFLLGNGRLVLGDLGISKVLEGTMDFAQTCIGTPYYMSPEIFKNKPYSYKSDVWALGCVLYEMTTLNHAFDANSLNGLAQKIIKGRYPAIDGRYSRYLRELIGLMLLPEPKQRPDLDQILRKPFIKKHICQFFQDIVGRPSEGIGEGTMIVRAAVGGPLGALGNDANMIALRQQLESLDMTQAISEIMAPISQRVPHDESEAKKLAKEAANALKREKDHRKMVESALEKLRQERESRAKERLDRGGAGQGGAAAAGARREADRSPAGPRQEPNKPAALRQPRPGAPSPALTPAPSVRERSKPEISTPQSRGSTPESNSRPPRRQSEARDRLAEERDRRAAEQEREKAEEARQLREREEASKRREEVMQKAARDQARAQADVAARREAHRERERLRQAAEIEQLKLDKLELDKRARDRDSQREQRRKEERAKIDEARKDQYDSMQDKLSDMSDQVGRLGDRRAEEKERGSDISARDRVIQRKKERQAKEDADRAEALLLAEEENRRIRAQAYNQQHGQFHPGADSKIDQDYPQGKNSDRRALGMDELTAKLHNAKGAPRYDRGVTAADDGAVERDSDSEGGEEEELWGEPGDEEEEEEIMHQREEELEAELNLATKRCQELKETLQVTKSFIEGKAIKGADAGRAKIDSSIPSDEDDDLEEATEMEEYEDEPGNSWEEQSQRSTGGSQQAPPSSAGLRRQETNNVETPRVLRATPLAVAKQPSYKNLVDAPSPSGRLGDRIVRLRQRCTQALGQRSFNEAYNYLKEHANSDEASLYGDDVDQDAIKMKKLTEILGRDKSHYMSLIEQLIFMEETHSG